MKQILKKILNIFLAIIGCIFFGITSIFLFNKTKENEIKNDAEHKKEETKNELEKKSADDIATDSPNSNVISSNIAREKEDFRSRVRDRLNKNI